MNMKILKNGMGQQLYQSGKKDEVVILGDGQVTLGDAVMKSNAKKLDRLPQVK